MKDYPIYSENLFHQLVKNSNDIISILNENGEQVFVSAQVERILGYTPTEMIGTLAFEGIHPEDLTQVSELFFSNLDESGAIRKVQYRYRHKSGQWIDLEAVGCNLLHDPAVKGVVLNIRDISERMKAEREIQNQELFLNRLIDQSPFATWISDSNGVMIRANQTLKDHLQLTDEQLVGKYNVREDPMLIEAGLISQIESVFNEGKTIHLQMSWSGSKTDKVDLTDARSVHIQATVFPIFDTNGTLTNAVCHWIDISEQKKVEEALRQSETMYRTLLENLPQKIFSKDRNSIFRSCNTNFANDLSITPQEIVGKSDYDFFPKNLADKYRQDDKDVMDSRRIVELEESYIKDGEEVIVNTIKVPTQDEHGNIDGIQGIFWDITASKRMEEEKQALEAQLQQSQKLESVGRLAGGVAHDFNNLLTSIIGNVQLIQMDLSPADPLHKSMNEIGTEVQRAADLTRQLLAFSRKQIIKPTVINLNALLDNMQKMLGRIIGEDIDLNFVYHENLGRVKADYGQIEQIVVNLAVNARDAMTAGGKLTIETDNVVLDEEYCKQYPDVKTGEYVLFAVSDNGIGMDHDTRQKIFEPFFTTKEIKGGTGLGLATVFGIVKQHMGHISVYSEVGKGTTFKVYLPLVTDKADVVRRRSESPDFTKGCGTILLVEDEQMVREIAIRQLGRMGYTVYSANDGEHALEVVAKLDKPIDLLMTDVIMPKMNGRQLAEKLGPENPDMKILFTSGYPENVIADHGILEADLEFIGKPYSPKKLATKIKEMLKTPVKDPEPS